MLWSFADNLGKIATVPAGFTDNKTYAEPEGRPNGEILSKLGVGGAELCHTVGGQAANAVSGAFRGQLRDCDAAAERERSSDFSSGNSRGGNHSTKFSTYPQIT